MEKLETLYQRVKSLQTSDAFLHMKLFRKTAYEMCSLFDDIFDKTMGKKGGINNPLTHQMLSSVYHLTLYDTENDFLKSLAIFDIYLHQIHAYIETQKFEKIIIHLNYHNEPIRILELEWDDVCGHWMPTLEYLDRQIEYYRDREYKDRSHKDFAKIWGGIATKYEARKKRLLGNSGS